jgi:hypothetical protein
MRGHSAYQYPNGAAAWLWGGYLMTAGTEMATLSPGFQTVTNGSCYVDMAEWWEAMNLYGMVTHIGGIHFAQLVMAERMAKAVGDDEFAKQCHAWLDARHTAPPMWSRLPERSQRELGLELIRRCQVALNRAWGSTWDQPNVLRGDSGQKVLGKRLVQNMLLWIVPAAAQGRNLQGFCAPGGMVDRMISAAL